MKTAKIIRTGSRVTFTSVQRRCFVRQFCHSRHTSPPDTRRKYTNTMTSAAAAAPPPQGGKMAPYPTGSSSNAPVIGTHSGTFHADEALAVFLLRQLPVYATSSVVRTRDPEVLKTCDIVVDVGGVHDHSQSRYDHHQRDFNVTFPGRSTKLSSAGLVWLHHGKEIISAVTGIAPNDANMDILYNKIYDDFIEAFDANDNGVSAYDPTEVRKAGLQKKFSDKGYSIASVVGRYNNIPSDLTAGQQPVKGPIKEVDQKEEDARFARASDFVGEQFLAEISDLFNSWLPARAVVQEAFDQRQQYDSKGRIIVIPWRKGGVPWTDHLFAIEETAGVKGQVLYALFPENGDADSKWRIRAVPLEPGSFESRKPLPESWRGLRDYDLSSFTGIPGCVFVHAAGFIGANLTFVGILEMAKKALTL